MVVYCDSFATTLDYFAKYLDIYCIFDAKIFDMMMTIEISYFRGWYLLWLKTDTLMNTLNFKITSMVVAHMY